MNQPLTVELMALRVARELQPDWVVNLGIGLPTQVGNVLPPHSRVVLHAENGVIGYGPYPPPGQEDPDLVNAGGEYVTLLPGAAIVNHADAFGMIRGGHVDCAVLGAFQVSQRGDLANWAPSTRGLGSPGGAVDLAQGARQVFAMLRHTTRDGKPRILKECTYPLTGRRCVSRVFTDLAVISVTGEGLVLEEVAPGWTVEEVQALTEPYLIASRTLREMEFTPPPPAPPRSKVYVSAAEAIADVFDGAMVGMDGFGGPGGMPHCLILALREKGTRDLTIVSNTAGIASATSFGTPPGYRALDHSVLIESGQVRKVIASFPVTASPSRPSAFELAYRRGEVELELSPQGTLAERLRAGGYGIAAFYTPTGAGTLVAQGKETRLLHGREHVLETALRPDFALVRAWKADTRGNLLYRGTSRNFNPVMAAASRVVIAEVDEVVEAGELDPEAILTPGTFVDRIVVRPRDFSPYVKR